MAINHITKTARVLRWWILWVATQKLVIMTTTNAAIDEKCQHDHLSVLARRFHIIILIFVAIIAVQSFEQNPTSWPGIDFSNLIKHLSH